MAAAFSTTRIPAHLTISAGLGDQHEIMTGDFELVLTMTAEPPQPDASSVTLNVDGRALRTAIAQALRDAADDVEAR